MRRRISLRVWVALAASVAALIFAACNGAEDGDDSDGITGAAPTVTAAALDQDGLAGEPVGDILLRDFTFSLPLFASDSAWNQSASDAAVLPESEQQMLSLYRQLLGDVSSLEPADELVSEEAEPWPFLALNYEDWSFPVFEAAEGEQAVVMADYEGSPTWPSETFVADPEPGGTVTVPRAAGALRPAGPELEFSDGHLVLYDPRTLVSYEFWQAATVLLPEGGSTGGRVGTTLVAAGAAEAFDVRGAGVSAEGRSSAAATGTSLLAGTILPEDVAAGAIAHALRFAIPGPRNTNVDDPSSPPRSDYFYPASTAETDYYSTDPLALASGQRLRMRQMLVDADGEPIDENELAPITRMVIEALRTYGAYLVDASGGFALWAEDIHTANLQLSDAEVNVLTGHSADAPLPPGKTKWQLVMEQLDADLASIPVASGPWDEYGRDARDPHDARFDASNFDVVEPAQGDYPSTLWTPQPVADAAEWWVPALDSTWQLQLSGVVNTSFDVDVYDIDLFDTSRVQIAALQGRGHHVVCYFSAGSVEDWRADASAFTNNDIGEALDGWDGERWLDIRSGDVQTIMLARLDAAEEKGCDGVDPDNVDGFDNETGFPLVYEDQLAFNGFLAAEAHARGLAIGLKNDGAQVIDLVGAYDFALVEECHEFDECDAFTPFVGAGKAVFSVEYAESRSAAANLAKSVCRRADGLNLRALILPIALDDSFRVSCDDE